MVVGCDGGREYIPSEYFLFDECQNESLIYFAVGILSITTVEFRCPYIAITGQRTKFQW